MQTFTIEIKTFDDKVFYLENSRKGYADWTLDKSKAKVLKTLDAAITMYNRTARLAVCKTSGIIAA